MAKIWHKPLHKRKLWKRMSLCAKIVYYLKPFWIHMRDVWLQPLPFPTLFKFLYSCFLLILVLLPIVFPLTIIVGYYAVVQYLIESSLDIVYPKNLDLIHYLFELFNFETRNDIYGELLNLYVERCRFVITATSSCVDNMRLILVLVTI